MLIAIDFDGTIVTHEYPNIGKEIPFAFATLKKLIDDGHRLILWTVREGQALQEAVDFCRSKGIEFYAINSNYPEKLPAGETQPRKLLVDVYVDDRNIGGLPDWGVIYRMIASGNPLDPASAELQSEIAQKKKKWGIF